MTRARLQIRFDQNAKVEALTIDGWWRENRPSAPNLFRDELEGTAALIAANPSIGRLVQGRAVRRAFMRKTRYHVYYFIDQNVVVLLAIWHATRGQGPSFL